MKRFVFLIPLSFLLTACPDSEGNEVPTNAGAPESADGIVIQLHEDGGMLPLSEDIYISEDSAHWKLWRSQYETIIRWKPTQEEIDDIYAVLKNNHFTEIKSDCEGEVFDRGGTAITVDIGGKYYDLSNSGNCFIKEKWGSSYSAINGKIRGYAGDKVNEQMFDLTIEPGEELLSSGYLFTMNVNEESIYTYDGEAPTTKNTRVYPGYNEVYLQLFYKDSTNSYGSPKTFISGQEFILCTDSTTQLNVELIDTKFELELVP